MVFAFHGESSDIHTPVGDPGHGETDAGGYLAVHFLPGGADVPAPGGGTVPLCTGNR